MQKKENGWVFGFVGFENDALRICSAVVVVVVKMMEDSILGYMERFMLPMKSTFLARSVLASALERYINPLHFLL